MTSNLPDNDTSLEHAISWAAKANSSSNTIRATAAIMTKAAGGVLLIDKGRHKIVVGQSTIEVQQTDGVRVFPPAPEWKDVPPSADQGKTHVLDDDEAGD